MATKKSPLTLEQKELEAPVKGYQLKALTDKFVEMKDEFSTKLDSILAETKGIVTKAELKGEIETFKEEIYEAIDDAIEKVHLEYRPTKNAAWWVLGAITTALIAQLAWQLLGG